MRPAVGPRAAALCVAAVVALAGCSGDSAAAPAELPPIASSSPSVSAAPSAAPTPEDTPTSTASTSPGAFDEATQASAEAFVRSWWTSLDAVGKRPAETLTVLFGPSCRTCREYLKEAQNFEDAGYTIAGGETRVDAIEFDTNEGRTALVESVITPQAGTIFNPDGSVARELQGSPQVRFVFNLLRSDGTWIIQDLLNLGATG